MRIEIYDGLHKGEFIDAGDPPKTEIQFIETYELYELVEFNMLTNKTDSKVLYYKLKIRKGE